MKKFMGVSLIIGMAVFISCFATAFAAEPPKTKENLAATEVEYVKNTGKGEVTAKVEVRGFIVPLADPDPGKDKKDPDPDKKDKPDPPDRPDAPDDKDGSKNGDSKLPYTGESNTLQLPLITGLTSMFLLLVLLWYRRKKDKRHTLA